MLCVKSNSIGVGMFYAFLNNGFAVIVTHMSSKLVQNVNQVN